MTMERVRQLLQSEQPVKWLFYGDSITHGALHTFGYRDYARLLYDELGVFDPQSYCCKLFIP